MKKLLILALVISFIGCTVTPITTEQLVDELNQKYVGMSVTHGTKTEIYNKMGDWHYVVNQGFGRYFDYDFNDYPIRMTIRKTDVSITFYKFEKR